jgi:tRNA-2-methylthio-N6-dimethylallyladenosine synthase
MLFSMPGVWIKNFGCQTNVYDAERISALLRKEGYHTVTTPAAAQLIVLNTCHIREKATEKLFSDLGRLRALKTGPLPPKIFVTGCVAQALGKEIWQRAPWVDGIVGPQATHRLPDLLRASSQPVLCLEKTLPEKFQEPILSDSPTKVTALLVIQEGCDNGCTYCVVPSTRGRSFSRPVASVLEEARTLLQQGVREITLVGQNVNAYCAQDETGALCDFGSLLFLVAALPGIKRLRYTTSHPQDITDTLLRAHATLPSLMPAVHLPVQSGSDAILRAMKRPYTRTLYLEALEKLRAARSDIAFSSDFIVGFPGETEEDFQATLALVEEVSYAQAYAFKYSIRPGTPAASLPEQVPDPVKKQRLASLLALLETQQQAFYRQHLGQVVDVLFEKRGRHLGEITGRTPHFLPVVVQGSTDLIGSCCSVRLTKGLSHSLQGEIAESSL